MTVFVDNVRFRYRGMIMCHMWADELPDLHRMASRIGLRREWFQEPPRASWRHYDVSLTLKKRALALGAVATDRYGALEHVARLDGDLLKVARIEALRARRAQS